MREQTFALTQVKRLLWLYFWLLIFEGALRKWVIPSMSAPLLIVRDPVVILTYFYATQAGLFPKNGFVGSIIALGVLSILTGLLVMLSSEKGNITVPLFGFRASFLHLPLIFIFPLAMTQKDLLSFGRWILVISLPMTALLVLQYGSGTSGWLNVGAGGIEGSQLAAASGKIRPAGTFSFVSGTVDFYTLVTVFTLYGIISRGFCSIFLLVSSGLSLAVALAVSGSRSAIFSAGFVVIMLAFAAFYDFKLLHKAYKIVLFTVIVLFITSSFQFFNDGIQTTTERFESANSSENIGVRILDSFMGPLYMILDVPILGYGLGVGTNVGSMLLTGEVTYLLSEGEWGRIILESGPILGLVFILWRVALAFLLARYAIFRARGRNSLPLLLVGACIIPLITGQFGQSTTAGFAVFISGLCLLACQSSVHLDDRDSRA